MKTLSACQRLTFVKQKYLGVWLHEIKVDWLVGRQDGAYADWPSCLLLPGWLLESRLVFTYSLLLSTGDVESEHCQVCKVHQRQHSELTSREIQFMKG